MAEVMMRDSLSNFKEFLNQNYQRLDTKIGVFNQESIDNAPSGFAKSMSYFTHVNAGGKMLRGVLANMGYYICGGKDVEYSDELALSLEIFQSSILIHDDLLDHGNTRRGKETVHVRIFKEFNISNAKVLEDSPDIMKDLTNGVSVALGYMGLYMAYEKLIGAYGDNPNLSRLLHEYNDMVIKTVEGGIMDVIVPFQEKYKEQLPFSNPTDKDPFEIIEQLALLKTAYYTTMGPIILGMILKGADQVQIDKIADIMLDTGLAFQIQDDILGIYADWDDLGKDIGGDIVESKQTFMYVYVRENNPQALEELSKYYGKASVSGDEVSKVQEIFKTSGAYQFAYDKMEFHYNRAKQNLAKVDFLDEEAKSLILGFILYLEQRKK